MTLFLLMKCRLSVKEDQTIAQGRGGGVSGLMFDVWLP